MKANHEISLLDELRRGVQAPLLILAVMVLPGLMMLTWLTSTRSFQEKSELFEDAIVALLKEPLATGNDFEVLKRLRGLTGKFEFDVCVLTPDQTRTVASSSDYLNCIDVIRSAKKKDVLLSDGNKIGVIFSQGKGPNFQILSSPVLVGVSIFLALSLILVRLIGVISRFRVDLINLRSATVDLDSRRNSSKTSFRYLEFNKLIELMNGLIHSVSERERDAAIARTTQALAHDVRKPFSMFKMLIETVQNLHSVEEAKHLMQIALPEVNQAMASVEGMIQDVMHIGSESRLHLEDVTVESIIEASVSELFRVHPSAHISLSYDLRHKHLVKVDTIRLSRVFANILGNALQAMQDRGEIWFNTTEREGFLEFVIGNSGSFIPAENLSKLFDAFFTSGKKGGTGLGLAIAKKTVELHGGMIYCRSERSVQFPQGKVEFVFTLPLSGMTNTRINVTLPKHSSEFQSIFEKFKQSHSFVDKRDQQEVDLEEMVIACLRSQKEMPTIVVADDEAVYRNNISAIAFSSSNVFSLFNLKVASNDAEVMTLVAEGQTLLLIQDIDMGPHSRDGLQVINDLRESGYKGQICVHSNRFLDEDVNQAISAGANFTIPKPMSRVHFLKLLLASLESVEKRKDLES